MSDETTVFEGSPSLMTHFGSLFLGGVVLLAALVGLVMYGDVHPAMPWMLGVVAVGALIFIAWDVIVHKSTHYEVTTERIRIRRGILNKRTDEVELYRASDTSLIEPFVQRLLGLGTIEIRTMEKGTPAVMLEALHGARALRETLRTNIEICRERKRVLMMEMDDQQIHTSH